MAKIIDNSLNNQTDNCGFDNSTFKENTNQKLESNKNLVNTLGQLLPFAPLLFEQFTGQKIAQPIGTIADIQNSINNLALNLQQISAFQQQTLQRLTILENNASQQLNSLDRRLQSLRLTHEKERKSIEYNRNSPEEGEEYN